MKIVDSGMMASAFVIFCLGSVGYGVFGLLGIPGADLIVHTMTTVSAFMFSLAFLLEIIKETK